MADSRHSIYFNGQIVPPAAARLLVDDRAVLFGLGFFETFRTSGGRPHHWTYNRRRLEQACATAGITIPANFLCANTLRLHEVVSQLLHETGLPDAVFRYTITAGAEGAPSEFLTVRLLPPAAPAEGICLRVLKLARDNGEWLPRPKSLNYANALLGAEELRRRATAPVDEGLFLSRDGRFVVETPRQNIAWLEGARLCYPDSSLGAIAGTCLQWLLELGQAAEPRRAQLGELLAADAIVVLNSVRGITPVREVSDAEDRARLRSFDSHTHPLVAAWRDRWNEALRTTADR